MERPSANAEETQTMFTTEILYQPAYAIARLTMSRGAPICVISAA